MFPIDYGFNTLQEWETEDHFVFPKMCDIEFADEDMFVNTDAEYTVGSNISSFRWRSIDSVDMVR